MNGDREGNRLIEMAEDAFLTQIVTQPTRENNILDQVFASEPDLIRDCKVGGKLSGCDHHLIRFNIKTEYTLNDKKKLRLQTTEKQTSIVHPSYYPQPPGNS